MPARVFTGLLAASLAGVLLVASCTQPLEPILIQPTSIAAVTSTVTAKAGRSLTGVAFTVADQENAAMQGETVNFTVDGGTVSPATVQTDQNGKATIGGWVVPNTPGTYHLTAKVAGTSLQGQVAATVEADDPAIVAAVASSNGQSAPAGNAVTNAPGIEVKDKFGNPVRNVQVTFAVASGGGTITGANATTDASGIAKVGSWVLGKSIGANTLTATVPGTNINGNPVTITANGTAGPPSKLAIAASSDAQTGIAGTNIGIPPSVVVTDANNNAVAGAVVIMKIASGAGKLYSNDTDFADSLEFTTNASGVAAAFAWKLGSLGGNSIAASVKGSTIAGVTISATGIAGAPATVTIVAETPSSDNQTAIAQQLVTVSPAVVVKDVGGNVVSGASVTFTVTGGGGKVLTASTDLTGATSAQVTTDGSGVARSFGWKLGDPGAQALVASLTSASTISATFTATSTSGPPASIAIVTETPSSNGQTAIGNTTLPVAPAVVVKDANNYPVAGRSIQFQVTAGAGTVTSGTTTAATVTVTTNATGVARVTGWKIKVGANSLVATVVGSTSLTASFSATGIVGPPTTLTKSNLPYGFVRQSTNVLGSAQVRVSDAGDNGVSGVTVTWAVSGTNSSATATTSITGSTGLATFPGTWTAGATLGTATLVATVSAVTPALTTNFTTKIVGAPTQLTVSAGNNQSVTVNTAAPIKPAVLLRDANGDPVPGNSVTFAITGGTGTIIAPSVVNTDSIGVATVGGWQMPTAPAAQSMSATAAGSGITGNPVSFTATAVAGPPASITINAGNNQTQPVNSILPTTLSVTVRDALSNLVSGATVTFTPQGTTNAVASPTSTTTNGSGIATATWRIDTIAGSNTLVAAASSSVTTTFTATGTALAPSRITVTAGNNQTATVSTTLPIAPAVKVTDQYNNPLSGLTVSFTPAGGSGSVSGSPATTLSTGVATLGSWTLGATVGTQSLTAAVTSAPSVNVVINATGASSATCNDRTIVLGTVQSGTFGASECTTTIASTLVRYQGFLMTVPASTTTTFSASMSSSAFAPRLQALIYAPTTAYWYSDGTTGTPATSYYILGPGSHRINATTTTSGSTGAYNFSTVSNPSLTGVCAMTATKGITVTHSLESSCSYTSPGATDAGGTTGTRYYKDYRMFVPAGSSVTARMSSAATCTGPSAAPCKLLEIYNANTNAFISTDNGSGVLTFTASSDTFILITATHRLLAISGVNSAQTGAYTFSIDP